MTRRRLLLLAVVALVAAGFWWATRPQPSPVDATAVAEQNEALGRDLDREQAIQESLPDIRKRAEELRRQLAAEEAERKLRGK